MPRISRGMFVVALFCSALAGFLFLHREASAFTSGDGLLLFGETGTSSPRYRTYSSSTNAWSSITTVPGSFSGTPRFVTVQTSQKRDEAVAGVLYDNMNLRILLWNGSAWSQLASTTAATSTSDAFDIAYEWTTGDAIVVVASTTYPVYYVWNGGSLSGPTAITEASKASSTNKIIRLASKATSTSDNVALAYSDKNGYLNALIWNGSGWAQQTASTTALSLKIEDKGSSTSTYRSFDLAYESLSGDLLIMWGNNGTADPQRVTYSDAGAWGSITTEAAFSEVPSIMELDSSPWTDHIAIRFQDDILSSGNYDSDCALWDGSAISGYSNCDTSVSGSTVGPGDHPVAAGWVQLRGDTTNMRSLKFYSDAPDATLDFHYASTTGVDVASNFTPSPVCYGGSRRDISLVADENLFAPEQLMAIMMATTTSAANAGLCSAKTAYPGGNTFGFSNAGGNAIIATTSVAGYRPFDFKYFRTRVLTVSATGTQVSTLTTDQADQNVGGAFIFEASSSEILVKQIVLSETNTVDADTYLSTVDVRYEYDATKSCSYSGSETLFGTAASFSSQQATVSGTLAASTTPVCIYVELNVAAGASGSFDIAISNPTSSVTVWGATVSPGTAVAISGTSTFQAPSYISIQGICRQFDQSTNCTNAEKVRVAVNSTLKSASTTTLDGSWTISNVVQPTSGDTVTIFIDGPAGATNRATAVTKWDGSGDITGVVLYEGHLTLGSDDIQTVSNVDISKYDNFTSSDADLFFEVNASNNLTVDSNSSFTNERLMVRAGNVYQPDSSGAPRIITTVNFYASSTATTTANGSIFQITNAGSFLNYGAFTAGTSTVEFAGSGGTIDCANCIFYNLTASSTATTTLTTTSTVSNTLQVGGTLSINASRALTASATTTLNGIISGSGTIIFPANSTGPGSSGTLNAPVRYDASSADVATTTFDARTYNGLVEAYASSSAARALILANGTYNFVGGLNIFAGGTATTTLNASTTMTGQIATVTGNLDFTGSGSGSEEIFGGTNTWAVSGNADFTGGFYRAVGSSTLQMTGTGTLTTAGNTLRHLTINSAGTVTLAAAATTTVNGNLTLAGAGTPVFTNTTILMTSSSAAIEGGGKTVNNLTASSTGTLTVQNTDIIVGGALNVAAGTLSIAINRTAIASSSLILGGTVSGAGRLTYRSSTAFPTTGTISSILRFDTTGTNQTMSNRIYAGAVEIDNSGSTAGRTVSMSAGTHTLQSTLTILSSGSGSVELTGASGAPTVTLTGDLTYTAGGGTKTITTGSGTWTASGNVNLTNGTFTASNGNTLVMSGSSKTLTSNAQTLKNLTLSGSITLADATHTVNGNLNMTGGTVTAGASTILMTSTSASVIGASQTLYNLTASSTGTITLQTSDLTVSGTLAVATSTTLSLSSSRTLTHTGATLTLNGTISGDGRLVYRSATTFPTTGTISSILRFDTASSSQTMPARIYGGTVEIDNLGSTGGPQSGTPVKIGDSEDMGTSTDFMPHSTRQVLRTSGGNLYAVLSNRISLGNDVLTVWKSIDNGATWTEKDTANRPTTSYKYVSAAMDSGGTIHISYIYGPYDRYITFNTNTDTFAAGGYEDAISCLGGGECLETDISLDSNNIPHIVTNYFDDGVGTNTLYYANRIGGTWNLKVLVQSFTGLGSLLLPVITINADDAPEIAYRTPTSTLMAGLGDANNTTWFTLQALSATVSSTPSIAVDSSNNTWIAYGSGTSSLVTLIKHNSGDSWATWQASTTNNNDSQVDTLENSNNTVSLVVNGTDKYVFYRNTDANIVYDKYDGSWAGETASAVGTYGRVKARWSYFIDNGSSTGIDYLFADGTDAFYNSLSFSSSGGGATSTSWTNRIDVTTSTTAASSDVSIAVASSGVIYVVYDYTTDGLTYDVVFRKSSDGGITWSNSVTIVNGGGTFQEYPQVAVASSSGVLYVVYGSGEYNASYNNIAYRKSSDGGTTWSNRIDVTTTTSYLYNPSLSVASSGDLHVAYYGYEYNGSYWNIAYRKSTNGGTTWSNRINVTTSSSAESWGPSLSLDSSGNPRVAYQGYEYNALYYNIAYRKSSDGGTTWSSRIDVTTSSSAESWGPSLSVASSGDLHVAYYGYEYNSYSNIAYRKSTNGGTTWSNRINVTTSSSAESWGPSLSVASSGDLHVAYYGTEYGANNIAYRKSADGGTTWSDRIDVTTGTTRNSYSPSLSLDSSGNPHVAYNGTEYSASAFNIAFRKQVSSGGGGGAKTVSMTAGTHTLQGDLTILASGSGGVELTGSSTNPTVNIAGNLTYTAGGGTGTITAGSGNWTILGNLDVSGGSFTAPASLNLAGNYANTGGTFTHNSGTVTLNGSSTQTLSGTLSESSSFNNLTVQNNSGSNPETSPSVILGATTTATTLTIAHPSAKLRFTASSTYTFTNINWNGQATTTRVALRSSTGTSTKWFLSVATSGSQTVSNVDVRDSNASWGTEINASDGTNLDGGGNVHWRFTPVVAGELSLQNHASGQPSNVMAADEESSTLSNLELLRFRLGPTTESVSVTTTTVSLSNVVGFATADVTTAQLWKDVDDNGTIGGGDSQLGSNGTVSISGGAGSITFSGSWSLSVTSSVILRATLSNIADGDDLTFSLDPAQVAGQGATSLQTITGSGIVQEVRHARPFKAYRGGPGAQGGAPPAGTEIQGGDEGASGGVEGPPPTGTTTPGGDEGGGQGGSAYIPSKLFASMFEALGGFTGKLERFVYNIGASLR